MSQEDLVTRETFTDIASRLRHGKTIVSGKTDDGFVKRGQLPHTDYSGQPLQSGVIVGYKVEPDYWVVGLMHKQKETIGQNEARIKVRENVYTRAEMWEIDEIPNQMNGATEIAEYVIENGNRIDTGYINGYRLTQLRDVINEIFKWQGSD